MTMRPDDLVITIAYFSIPIQILVSLWQYPRLASMPTSILVLLILFALFIFLCGAGHLLRCMGKTNDQAFAILNALTAFISLTTAVYLLPLIPSLMSTLDEGIQNLARMNEETAESKRQLLTFMSFLCHEMRNPLFAITSTLAFLEDDHDDLTMDQSRAVASIDQSTKLMLRLVNDVLDLRKIESGKLELEERLFDVKELLSHVAASTEMQLQKQRSEVEFVYTLSLDVPRIIAGDSVRLLQIAYNLLSNACKFTERGRIEFTISTVDYQTAIANGLIPKPPVLPTTDTKRRSVVSLLTSNIRGTLDTERHETNSPWSWFSSWFGNETNTNNHANGDQAAHSAEEGALLSSSALLDDRSTRNGGARRGSVKQPPTLGDFFASNGKAQHIVVLKVEVTDTGPGIPPDRMGVIFEPYTQSKLSDYRKHGGTGLGLSILLRLSRQMGGDICAVSQVGVGSTFVSYLPVAVPNDTTTTELETDSSLSDARLIDLLALDTPDDLLEDVYTGSRLDRVGLPSTTSASDPPLTLALKRNHSTESIKSRESSLSINASSDSFKKPASNKTLSKFEFAPNQSVVLVVDDNNLNRRLIGRMLSHFNLEYEQASNGQEAIDMILKSRNMTNDLGDPLYALILMDMCMPVLGGVDATRMLRLEHACTIPIVALTANAANEFKDEAMQAGCTDFITKPILREHLYRTCQHYLGGGSISGTDRPKSTAEPRHDTLGLVAVN